MSTKTCPHCGSSNIQFDDEFELYICYTCGKQFSVPDIEEEDYDEYSDTF